MLAPAESIADPRSQSANNPCTVLFSWLFVRMRFCSTRGVCFILDQLISEIGRYAAEPRGTSKQPEGRQWEPGGNG